MYHTSSNYMIDTDEYWNKRYEMIKVILAELIEENKLQSKSNVIFYTLKEFIKETKSKKHIFKTDTEINQYILFRMHQYISSVHQEHPHTDNDTSIEMIENNTDSRSQEQERVTYIQQHFEKAVQERDNEMKPNIPPSIDFKDANIDNYNMNTMEVLGKEIEYRKEFIAPSNSQKEKYIWLDKIDIKNNILKLKLPNDIQSCIINRVFFMNQKDNNDVFPDYIQLKTSTEQTSWFFKHNTTNVLHYTGEMNIYTNESDILISLEKSLNTDNIKVFIQVKL